MKRKKRTLTLIEIMIVIVLIGLIGSVIGVNMKGSMDKGRAFKTEQAIQQIEDIFNLELAQGTSVDYIMANKVEVLRDSGLIKDPEKFLKDGWNNEFEVRTAGGASDKRFVVVSERLRVYNATHNRGREEKKNEQDQQIVHPD